uniref:Uncharacterized protein n=1 Tax=Anguilla anguilla TaxID=7936 RepID=A0A0E9XKR9_ANGAN
MILHHILKENTQLLHSPKLTVGHRKKLKYTKIERKLGLKCFKGCCK